MTNVLGVLPLRAGSKGLPKKNTKKMLDKPLFAWAADALISAQSVQHAMCSTENKNIALAAESRGLSVPFLRPEALASDTAKISDVLTYTLEKIKDTTGEVYTHVTLVQATSPCVLPSDIDRAVELALEKDADTVISVFRAEHNHPHLMFRQTGEGDLKWLISEQNHQSRRQDREEIYIRAGLVYVMKADVILNEKSIYGTKIFPYVVDEARAVNIDSFEDFEKAAIQLRKMKYE